MKRWVLIILVCLSVPLFANTEQKAEEAIRAIGGLILPSVHGLEVQFHLSGRELTDADLVHVAVLGKKVALLNLRGTQVSSAGLRHLAGLTGLRRLYLERTNVGDAGLEQLASLKQLEYLNLYGTRVGDAGLAKLKSLSRLKQLYVWQTKVTDSGCTTLQRALPDLRIVRGEDIKKLTDLAATRAVTEAKKEAAEWTSRVLLKWKPPAVEPPHSKTGPETTVLIRNTRKQAVKLYWSQYEGGLRHYQDIPAGETITRQTFANAIWVVTTLEETRLGHFFVPASASRIEIAR